MQRYFDVVQNRQGTAVVGATVTVYDSNGNLATLYSTNSGTAPTSNPVYTNADGEYAFYAANGTYTIQIAATGYAGETKPGVVLFDPSDSGASNNVQFLQAGTGAQVRSVQSKLRDVVSVKDFGAVGDWNGATGSDDFVAFDNAIASGKPVFVPSGRYKVSQTLVFSGNNKCFVCDNDVIINYTGNQSAILLSGNYHNIYLGEVTAQNGTEVVKYSNLQFSKVFAKTLGVCSNAVVLHDAANHTVSAGNNVWDILVISAQNANYGIFVESNNSQILEGESWNVKVIFSATLVGVKIGSSSSNKKVRWNEYNISVDPSGITQKLIEVNDDYNYIYLRTWADASSSTDVTFTSGTEGNFLFSQPGTGTILRTQDLGNNYAISPGTLGQTIYYGDSLISKTLPTGGAPFQVENSSSANNTTKYVGIKNRGRDTANGGKDVLFSAAFPSDSDWVNATYQLQIRRADNLAIGMLFFGTGSPEGVITAPVGAIYTRQDGGVGTTFYVKEFGTGNTGWGAK